MNNTKSTIKDIKGNIIGTVSEVNGKKVWIDNQGKIGGKVILSK